jgi:hypothetical protein
MSEGENKPKRQISLRDVLLATTIACIGFAALNLPTIEFEKDRGWLELSGLGVLLIFGSACFVIGRLIGSIKGGFAWGCLIVSVLPCVLGILRPLFRWAVQKAGW